MIEKIMMNKVASYKQETILETEKKVNLIYGLNGTGKSTISNYLYDSSNEQYKECSITGLRSSDEIIVYNQKFIQENFYESDKIKGIFSLSQENKQARQAVDNAEKEREKLDGLLIKQSEIVEGHRAEKSKKENAIKESLWKIKTDYTGGDRVLEYCLDNLKGNKNKLFEHIIKIEKPKKSPSKNVEEIKQEVQSLSESEERISKFKKIYFGEQNVEREEIFFKEIVGNKNSSVSGLIEKLGNSDWVKQGLMYTKANGNETTICPFCQSKTMTETLIKEIEAYFDVSYENDLKKIEEYVEKYTNSWNALSLYIFDSSSVVEKYKKDFELQFEKARNIIENNLSKMQNKLKAPSMRVELTSSEQSINELNEVIKKINVEINAYNKKIDNKEAVLKELKSDFWKLMRLNYDNDISNYFSEMKRLDAQIKTVQSDIEKLGQERQAQEKIIEVQQSKTISIEKAITSINSGLLDLGIEDFHIEKYPNEDELYQIIRNKHDVEVFQTLSEGEKMVISFLYFIELCRGRKNKGSTDIKKIVVIDDPISSLSHIFVFNIGRMIHNEFLRTDKYEQIIILTHSLYFFYELTATNKEYREGNQKLFRLGKNNQGSNVCIMKYEEIQNDYQSYWLIVKDKEQPPALIANAMRNIIEYFFGFVEKSDLNNVFQKKVLQENKYQAFHRYMNRESHSIGQNVFDYKEFNYDDFKEAFRLVFNEAGYENHYKKMIK